MEKRFEELEKKLDRILFDLDSEYILVERPQQPKSRGIFTLLCDTVPIVVNTLPYMLPYVPYLLILTKIAAIGK
jgi:hypothetical protein